MNATEPSSSQPAAGRLGLPSAIRAATHRALAARDQRLREYPHWEAWRRPGRDLKAAALDLVRRQPPGLVTLLTGVSRAADIEKVLTLGAHGPKSFHLWICF